MFRLHESRLAVTVASLTAAWVLAAAGAATAQNFDRYRPRLPEGRGQNDAELPDAPDDAAGDPRILVDSWRAIVFIDHRDALAPAGMEADGVVVNGNLPLLRSGAADPIARRYLGGPISLLKLNQFVRDIILLYRNSDQPVVDVSIPEQKISNGVVQVVVTEGRVGELRVVGPRFFKPRVLLHETWIRPGDRIYESVLNADLQWLSRNPFRRVDLELSPGDVEGTTDVEYRVQDQLPLRFYAGYEDTGTRPTGLERTIYGVTWSNAFWLDHQFGYQFTGSSDFKKLNAHSFVHQIPLHNRDTMQIFGSYAEVSSDAVGLFGVNGVAWQIGGRYNQELPNAGLGSHRLVYGVDFKQTNNNLEFGGAQVFASSADVLQFSLAYQGATETNLGPIVWGYDLVYGPSGLSGNNNDADYQTIRAGAEADYFYGRSYTEHRLPLPFRLNFVTRLNTQWADGNLLFSETIGFGGYYSIRGYDMRLVNGDSGYVCNLELATDPIDMGIFGNDPLQLLLFHDFGEARNHTLLPGEDPSVDLSSVGAGLRYALSPFVALRVDYGWQTAQVAALPTPRERWHVGVVLSR